MLSASTLLRRPTARITALALLLAISMAAMRWRSPSFAHDKPHVVTVVAHDFAFEMPESIPAGLTTFDLRNGGKVIHHLGIVRLDSGHTAAEAAAAIIKVGKGVRPAWLHPVGGPQGTMPGESANATIMLEPGSYLAFCEFPGPDPVRHYAKGMMKEFTVTPPSRAGEFPKADVELTLVDYDFVLSHPLTRGRHVIAVTNTAAQPHMVAIRRYPIDHPAGTAAKELTAWAHDPQGTIAPGNSEGGIMEISPGQTATMSRDFKPGLYLLICFTTDASDGKPHFAHGMQKEITIE
jgi:uncharacterized cupredoxin-like copper-binding protein